MRVNYAAVVVGAILYFLLGGLWYVVLFGTRWAALMGKTAEEMKQAGQPVLPFVVALGCNLIIAYVLALMCNATGAKTAGKGAAAGLLLWVGFVGTTTLTNSQFAGSPVELWAINYGYSLVGLVLMGALLGAWTRKAA
jgi:hypothetical protein